MGLAAVAAHKLGGFIPVGAIFKASVKIGQASGQALPAAAAGRKSLCGFCLH